MEKGFILVCSSRHLPIIAEKFQKSELLRVTSHLQGVTNACSVPFPHLDSLGSHAQEMVLPTMKSNLSGAGRMAQWVEVLVAMCKPRDESASCGILIKVEGENRLPRVVLYLAHTHAVACAPASCMRTYFMTIAMIVVNFPKSADIIPQRPSHRPLSQAILEAVKPTITTKPHSCLL